MKKALLLFLFIYFAADAFSQVAPVISSSPSIAQTSVADSRSWVGFHNPAALGNMEKTSFGFLFENRYFISELSNKTAQAGIVTEKVNVGLSLSHFGYSLYHEILAGLAFARNFDDKFSIGVQFNYYTAYFSADNQYRGALLGQVGISVRLSSNFNLGFNTFNPFQTNIKTEYVEKRLPSVYSIGSEYFFASDFVWRTQIDKEISSNYRFATGFEYTMLDIVTAKIGAYGFEYLVPSLGIGIHLSSFYFDLNCDLHPLLGVTTFGMIRYRL